MIAFLQGLAAACHSIPEVGLHSPQCMAPKELPLFEGISLRIILLQLVSGKGNHVGIELMGPQDDHIDVAVPAKFVPFL